MLKEWTGWSAARTLSSVSLVAVLACVCGCGNGVLQPPTLSDDTVAACANTDVLLYEAFALQAQTARNLGASQDTTAAAIEPTCELSYDPIDDPGGYDDCVACLTSALDDVYP